MTGRPNTIARFLPEAPEAGGDSQVAVEMIDWLQPEGEERGARAIYACSHPVLRRWMHHGLRWLLEGGEMPGMTPLPHMNVQLVHRMEPPAVTPPDYITQIMLAIPITIVKAARTSVTSTLSCLQDFGRVVFLCCGDFVASGMSFKAKPGQHDDLVSSCLLMTRMMKVLADFDPKIFEKWTDRTSEITPMPIFGSFTG